MRTSVEVHNFLIEREAPHEVFAARGRFRSPERIAAVLGLSPNEVGRVSIFEGKLGPVAAVVASNCAADPRLVAKAVRQRRVQPVADERAAELTGFLAESIPPAGLPEGFTVVVDRDLDRDDVLYFPGGEPRSILKIRGTDLVRAADATVGPIGRPSPAR
jgi:prolyl-tRNA editing enzyme YbaK/EbsC (Cys-tRNA(Pro) deacylase)